MTQVITTQPSTDIVSVDTPSLTRKVLVSEYGSFRESNPRGEVDLFDWFEGDMIKKNVAGAREYKDDKEEYSKWKACMPCITPSGRFTKRKISDLIEHSGYICLDIDGEDNPDITDFAQLRDEIAKIVNVAYSSLSLSTNGCFVFIPIKFPEKHKEHFNALRYIFNKQGIVLDKQCGDVSRLRAASYDSDRYINRDAIVFEGTMEKSLLESHLNPKKASETKRQVGKRAKRAKKEDVVYDSSKNYEKVQKVVSKLVNRGISIADSYSDWFLVGCALAHEFGEEGREFFHNVSMQSSKYKEVQNDSKYSECLAGSEREDGCKIGTFFLLAKQSLEK